MGAVKVTKLTECRLASRSEQQLFGAELICIRKEFGSEIKHTIYVRRNGENYSQWGAPTRILGDNVDTVLKWMKRPTEISPAWD